MFARETCIAVDKIAATLGPEACIFLSQDKSQANIGRLRDHHFVVGRKHKLTPGVIFWLHLCRY